MSDHLAAKFVGHVDGLRPGMPIQEALDRVFAHQERFLHDAHGDGRGSDVAPVAGWLSGMTPQLAQDSVSGEGLSAIRSRRLSSSDLNGDDARRLTDRIKKGVRSTSLLMLKAHEGHAWTPLGYATWEAYVRREFGLSRSRSYEVLIQGRVIRSIQSASGMSGAPDIPTRLAMRLRPRLEEIENAIRSEMCVGMTQARVAELVGAVVGRYGRAERHRNSGPRTFGPVGAAKKQIEHPVYGGNSSARRWVFAPRFSLSEVIEYLAGMPPIRDVLDALAYQDLADYAQLDCAARRLSDLASGWPAQYKSISA